MSPITVATQLYGWSQQQVFPDKPPLAERLDDTFAAIKRADIDNIEWNLDLFENMAEADRWYAALEKHGLGMESAYYGGAYHERERAHSRDPSP